MNPRLVLLNGVLLLVLIAGVMKLRDDSKAFWTEHQVSAIQPQPEAFPVLPLAAGPSGNPVSDWTEIPSRNPFSFDRNDIAILKPTPAARLEMAGPKPILFGTMSLGQGPLAMLATGTPGNRNSRPYKVGEVIDGWTLVEINAKTVVVEANGIRQTVIMNDPTAQVARDTTTTAPVAAPRPTMAPAPDPVSAPQSGDDEWIIQETPFGKRKVKKQDE